MNQRERILAMIVLGIVVVAGAGLIVYQFFLVPLANKDRSIALIQKDLAAKRDRINEIAREKPKLERWRQLSLPADLNFTRLEYERHLGALLRQSGFEFGSYHVLSKALDTKNNPTLPTAPAVPKPVDPKAAPAVPRPVDPRLNPALQAVKKDPIFTRLSFKVEAQGELSALTEFLADFYHTGLMQQIKNLTIRRPLTTLSQQRPNDLQIEMDIEALVIQGAENRKQLLPTISRRLATIDMLTAWAGGPAGVALVPWAVGPTGPLGPGLLARPVADYAAIAGKNIFFGPPPVEKKDTVDVSQFVYLTYISRSAPRTEALLYDRYNNAKFRLRESVAFRSFRIRDADGKTLVQGEVVRIDDRDVIFRAKGKLYSLHVGQSLVEAMKSPLKDEDVKSLGLQRAAADPPAR